MELEQIVKMEIEMEAEDREGAYECYNEGNYEVISVGQIKDDEWNFFGLLYEEIEEIEDV